MSILHVDLNSFYASCAVADSGGKYTAETPLIVCGDPKKRHGIVLAATYPVKHRGVRAGMPVWQALSLYPNAVLVPPEYARYTEYSEAFMQIIRSYSPVTMRYGIDESYVDYNGCEHLFGAPETAAHAIRERVKQELSLTVSVGVGDNMIMAKMGSDYKKPDAVTVVNAENWERLMWPLPVESLMYIGRASARRLRAMGVQTIGDLARQDQAALRALFGVNGHAMWERANGRDDTRLTSEPEQQKSVSHSTTLERDACGDAAVCAALLRQTEQTAYRLRHAGLRACVAGVHLRYTDLQYESAQKTLSRATDVTDELYGVLRPLALALHRGRAVRQIGVSFGRLTGEAEQLSLFDAARHVRMRALDEVTDTLRDKFGFDIVRRMSTLGFAHTEKDDFTPFARH